MKDLNNPLAALSFYHVLSHSERELLQDSASSIIVHNNDQLQLNAAINNGLILVVKGHLNLFLHLINGRQMSLFTVQEKEYVLFFERALVAQQTFNVTLSIDAPVNLIHIKKESIEHIRACNKAAAALMYEQLTKNLITALLNFEQCVSLPLADRVINCLKKHSNIQNTLHVKISHERIANELGSSREVITKVLRDLADRNHVSVRKGQITLHQLSVGL